MRYASMIITLMTAILFGCNSGGGSSNISGKKYSGKVYVYYASLSSQSGGSAVAGVMVSAITSTATLSDLVSTIVTTWPVGDISLTSTPSYGPSFLLTGTILNDTPDTITGFWYSVMPLPALMSTVTPTVSGFGILETNDWWSGSAMWNSFGSPGHGICTNPGPAGTCIAGNLILDPGVSINIGGGYIGDGGCGGNLNQAAAGCVATGSVTWAVKFYDTTGEDVATLPLYQICPYSDYSNMVASELTNVACMKFYENLITEYELGSSATYTTPHAPRAIGYIPFNIVP